MSSDNNYAPFIATTIISILENTKSSTEFYVLDCGIKSENIKTILNSVPKEIQKNIHFVKIDINSLLPNFPEIRYISIAMYGRILIPDLFPNISRAIYTDVDVIFKGDIKKLFTEDLCEYPIGACWEYFAEDNGTNNERKKRLGIQASHHYFNSGLLLIDCVKWREKNRLKNIIKLEKKLKDKLDCPDQDLLNVEFSNNYKELDSKYSVVNQIADYYTKTKKEIIIRHFNGRKKPWHYPKLIIPNKLNGGKEFWAFSEKTKFHRELTIRSWIIWIKRKLSIG